MVYHLKCNLRSILYEIIVLRHHNDSELIRSVWHQCHTPITTTCQFVGLSINVGVCGQLGARAGFSAVAANTYAFRLFTVQAQHEARIVVVDLD